MNWSTCDVVGEVSGKVSGCPIVEGTRVPAETILDNFNAGVSALDVANQYDVPLATVRKVIAFAEGKRASSAA